MRAKRGCAKEVKELREKILTLRRSIHGFVFHKEWNEADSTKQVRAEIAKLEDRLKEITI
jgi:hypothetical protein